MISGINAFMLNGMQMEDICKITADTGCGFLSVEIAHLYDRKAMETIVGYDLKINAAGSLFLDLDEYGKSCDKGKEVIRLCEDYKIGVLVIVLKSRQPDYRWMYTAVKLCRELATYARNEVCICIEPLSPSMRWVSCITQLWQASIVCDYVKCGNFGIILDTFHCGTMEHVEADIIEANGRIKGVHLSDMDFDGNACFPGDGILPIKKWFRILEQIPFTGVIELEVNNRNLIAEIEDKSRVFRKAFLSVDRIVVIGELAVHKMYDQTKTVVKDLLGGGAGMIAGQLNAIHSFPYLLGVCGNDAEGVKLSSQHTSENGFSRIVRQKGRKTSIVYIYGEDLAIEPGNIEVDCLLQYVRELENEPYYAYCPMFPGYENLYLELRNKSQIQVICDFGYYAWCGNAEIINAELARSKGGYIALINAKGISDEEKRRFLVCAVDHGFSYAITTDENKSVMLIDCGKNIQEFPVFDADNIRSTCGAGDSMVAGILYVLRENGNMSEALCRGINTAYHKIQTDTFWRRS